MMTTYDSYLGIDPGTNRTGYCFLSATGDLLAAGWIEPTGAHMGEKTQVVVMQLKQLGKELGCYNPRVIIEAPPKRWSRGASSAHTIGILNQYFGGILGALWANWRRVPYVAPVHEARKPLNLDKAGCPKKQVLKQMTELHPEHQPSYREITRGARKGERVLVDGELDAADAWALARLGYVGGAK